MRFTTAQSISLRSRNLNPIQVIVSFDSEAKVSQKRIFLLSIRKSMSTYLFPISRLSVFPHITIRRRMGTTIITLAAWFSLHCSSFYWDVWMDSCFHSIWSVTQMLSRRTRPEIVSFASRIQRFLTISSPNRSLRSCPSTSSSFPKRRGCGRLAIETDMSVCTLSTACDSMIGSDCAIVCNSIPLFLIICL